MISLPLRLSAFFLTPLLLVGAATAADVASQTQDEEQAASTAVTVQYLEIVTPSVDETCNALAQAHGLVFGEPIAKFGNARTAPLANGGFIGVRAPLRETEDRIVRPSILPKQPAPPWPYRRWRSRGGVSSRSTSSAVSSTVSGSSRRSFASRRPSHPGWTNSGRRRSKASARLRRLAYRAASPDRHLPSKVLGLSWQAAV